jgi:hypothetical protein
MPVEARKMSRYVGIPRQAMWAFGSWAVVFLLTIALGELYLHNSTPAAVAMAFAEQNPVVQDTIGGTVDARLNWIGSIHYDGDASWATFRLQVSGVLNNGTMDVTLQRRHSQWNVADGHLVTATGRVVEISDTAAHVDQARAGN